MYICEKLMKRQDSLCAVIKPLSAKKKKNHVLIGAHIIRRSIAKGNDSPAGVISGIHMFSVI